MGICCSVIKLFLTPIPGRGILPGRFIANKLLCVKTLLTTINYYSRVRCAKLADFFEI
jgi:hypothetical protein